LADVDEGVEGLSGIGTDRLDTSGPSPGVRRPANDLVVISGPSAVGKDAVVARLRERGSKFHLVLTTTTRQPRPDEIDGRDYQFVSTTTYDAMLAAGEFIEAAELYGNHYGIRRTAIDFALAADQDVILRIGPTGLKEIRRLYPFVISIFLSPTTIAELAARMDDRQAQGPTEKKRRLAAAVSELKLAREFDYVVFNPHDSINVAVNSVEAILLAEKCRADRSLPFLPGGA
jgi:guanylate kinase